MNHTISDCLIKLSTLEGYLGSYVVDSADAVTLGRHCIGTALDLESTLAIHSKLLKAQHKALQALGLQEVLEDVVITLDKQLHLIRMLRKRPGVFLCVALERSRANLGLTRFLLHELELTLEQ